MNEPIISVIMPVYNQLIYLPSAVNSIMYQTEQRFVLYIIDDGSTDGSSEYINQIKSEKVKVYTKGKVGLIEALNYGLSFVRTPYTAIMDADDLSHPERLKEQVSFLESDPHYSLIGTSVEYIGENENGRSIKIKMPVDHDDIYMGLQKKKYVLVHSTIMVRTEALKQIRGYREDSFPNPDYDLFLRIADFGKFSNVSGIFCKIRFHKKSHTSVYLPEIIRNLYQKSQDQNSLQKKVLKSRHLHRLREIKLYFITKSVQCYRRGVMKYVNNKVGEGILLILLSGIINPVRGINFLFKKLEYKS